jgi:hypothetical protein
MFRETVLFRKQRIVGLYHAIIGKGMKQQLRLITDFALSFQTKLYFQW